MDGWCVFALLKELCSPAGAEGWDVVFTDYHSFLFVPTEYLPAE